MIGHYRTEYPPLALPIPAEYTVKVDLRGGQLYSPHADLVYQPSQERLTSRTNPWEVVSNVAVVGLRGLSYWQRVHCSHEPGYMDILENCGQLSVQSGIARSYQEAYCKKSINVVKGFPTEVRLQDILRIPREAILAHYI